jgi:hypothetical protein
MPGRGAIVSTAGTGAQRCAFCGAPFDAVRPGQTYCRPSRRARHEYAQAQQERRLPFGDLDALLFDEPFE